MIKPGSLDYRVQKIVENLKVRKLWQMDSLVKWWHKDKKFLKEELRVWVEMANFDQVYDKIRDKIVKAHPQ